MKKTQTKREKSKFNYLLKHKKVKNLTIFFNTYFLTKSQLEKLIKSDFVFREERLLFNDKPTKVFTYLKICGKYYVIKSKQWIDDNDGIHFLFLSGVDRYEQKTSSNNS